MMVKVEQLIEKAKREHTGSSRQPDKPLIRLRVDYSDGFTAFNIRRFGQQFVDRVANPKDILLFFRKKQPFKTATDKRDRDESRVPHLRPEPLDTITMEDLIKEYLTSKDNALELRILTEGRMAQALREFVEKDEKDAISTLVKWQLDQAQSHLKKRQNIPEENIEVEVFKHTEEIRQKEDEDEGHDAEDIRKVLEESRASQINTGNDVDMSGSDDEDGPPRPSTSRGKKGHSDAVNTSTRGTAGGHARGRGRGRSRGGRGRGRAANTSQTIMDSFTSASKRKKQQSNVKGDSSDDDDDDEFNIPLSSSLKKTKTVQSTSQRSNGAKNRTAVVNTVEKEEESEDSDDPFSMQPSSKKSR